MSTTIFQPRFEDLPREIPIFPLSGVLLLPNGQLPLNIFEPRYIAMVEDALRSHRLIGMIQPRGSTDAVYRTGCAGRINGFNETPDGRFTITLKGLCRFHVESEMEPAKGGYRRVEVSWSSFPHDLDPQTELNIDRKKLCALLASYFDMEGMKCDWNMIDGASDGKLITCLSMACPLDAGEKQALLEAACGRARAELFMNLLEMAIRDQSRTRPERGQCH